MQLVARYVGASVLQPRRLTFPHIGRRVGSSIIWPSYFSVSSKAIGSRSDGKHRNAFHWSRRDISTFRYTPLDSSTSTQSFIRLLKLYPGNGRNPVETSLEETSLSSDPEYEAVSYCWGDDKDRSTISCNGGQLPVPRRLEVALRNMRYSDKPRILWADAICINQKDKAEKESQVQLMHTIFSKARQTLIFLGDIEDKQAQKISRSLAPFSFEFYLELIGMLRMPWFQRAWIVQEV
ncbi:HET-domain-containing protein, partial [Hyaloscypha variabilis F]